MQGISALLSSFASAFTQDNRFFSLHFSDSWLDSELLPHTFVGDEAVSAPFRMTIECLSSSSDLELKQLIGQGVDIAIHRDDDDRVISGIVTRSQQLGSDGGFARYSLTVEPALAVLKLRRNSRVFQDKSVVDIVGLILDEHIQNNPVFAQHFRYRISVTETYPARSYCQQYRESDFNFITRLLREEGISYYFDFEHGSDEVGLHTFVLFDAGSELNSAQHDAIRFHRADVTEDEDSITQWSAHRQIQGGSVSLASFDYKGVYTQQGHDASAIDHGEAGTGLSASLDDYDAQSLYYGADDSELSRYARLRQQARDLNSKRFSGAGAVRGLGAGQSFTLHDHPNHDSDNEFIVLNQKLEARNNLPVEFDSHSLAQSSGTGTLDAAGYRSEFDATRKHIPIVPDYAHTEHAKPTARGVQTATVVGPAGEEIYTDEIGRIKIQFHWARPQDHDAGKHGASADKNDFASCWVRVGYPSAGAGWGHQFIPRIGQEVIVDFIESDIDRPVIVGVVHNGQQMPPTFQNAGSLPANKTLSGIKTHEYKGGRHNELVFDDTTNEIRTTLSTEHGKTQLNQGYLIHPRTEGKGEARGEGFELRTDNAGALRAAQGLLVTTEVQPNANGKQLDRAAALAQLAAAQNLAQSLGDTAQQHQANKSEPDPALNIDQLKDKQPHLLVHGHDGLSITTPQSIGIAAAKDIHQVSQRDSHQTTGRRWISNATESISLFVAGAQNALKESFKLIAAKGDVQMQAQSADIEIDGDQSLTISACKETITASAKEKIVIHCGGAQIELSGGNITVSAPGNISLKGAQQSATGPTSLNAAPPAMPQLQNQKNFMELNLHHDDLTPAASVPYTVVFEDGTTRQGSLNGQGYARLENVPAGTAQVFYGESPKPFTPPPIASAHVTDDAITEDMKRLGLNPSDIDITELIKSESGRVL